MVLGIMGIVVICIIVNGSFVKADDSAKKKVKFRSEQGLRIEDGKDGYLVCGEPVFDEYREIFVRKSTELLHSQEKLERFEEIIKSSGVEEHVTLERYGSWSPVLPE